MSSYDQWLTTNHDEDGWISFCENVAEALANDFYDTNEAWIEEDNGQYHKLLDRLHVMCYDAEESAKIIERIHSLYKL